MCSLLSKGTFGHSSCQGPVAKPGWELWWVKFPRDILVVVNAEDQWGALVLVDFSVELIKKCNLTASAN